MAPAEAWPTDAEAIARAVSALAGRRRQRPPAYSAIKVGGRPLYERARSGEAVEPPERAIEVYEAACLGVDLGPAPGPIGGGPRVRFRVACSKGTYVRSLAADLGRALGCGAYLSALRRLRSGPFGLDRAVPLASLDDEAGRRVAVAALIPPEEAVGHLAAVSLDPDAAARLTQGQAVAWPTSGGAPPAPGSLVRVAAAGRPLLALAQVGAGREGHPVVRPVRVLNA
jgi:tRNA pseudouridine55 synthase